MVKKLFVALGFVYGGVASAAPFLVSEPYPINDPAKGAPTQFVITLDNQAPVTVDATKDASGQPYLKWDLAGKTGAHTIKVRAKNIWGESADTVPLAFTAVAPTVPVGLGFQP